MKKIHTLLFITFFITGNTLIAEKEPIIHPNVSDATTTELKIEKKESDSINDQLPRLALLATGIVGYVISQNSLATVGEHLLQGFDYITGCMITGFLR